MAGLWIGQHLEHTFDVWCTVIALQFYGVVVGWQINAGIVIERARLAGKFGAVREPVREIDRKTYTNLNEPELENGFVRLSNVHEAVTVQVRERDPRVQQLCYAVTYNGTPLTQRKWAGKSNLFSKPEFVRWMAARLQEGYVRPINPKDPKSSYKPNGAQGWKKFKDVADGRDYLPLPTANLDERDTQFLRAKMSRAS